MTLLELIPKGKAQATSVAVLSTRSGLTEREVRAELERLVREQRVPVVTIPAANGRSIFIAETPEELAAGIAHISAKAGALLKRKRALRQCSEALSWSPSLFGRETA